jgi:hypothetical protein
VIGTDCIGSCKSNYHMITATKTPYKYLVYTDKNKQRFLTLETFFKVWFK